MYRNRNISLYFISHTSFIYVLIHNLKVCTILRFFSQKVWKNIMHSFIVDSSISNMFIQDRTIKGTCTFKIVLQSSHYDKVT